MKCPACSGGSKPIGGAAGLIFKCLKCGAIHGQCYLGESYEHVLPYMTKEDVPPERTRYFDFTCLGSAGVTRRHGWYEPATKRIVQVG
jgi:hypothetical protein